MLVCGGENQVRCSRPCPADWLSAKTTVPWGNGFFPSSMAYALVEGNSSKIYNDSLSFFEGRELANKFGDNTVDG